LHQYYRIFGIGLLDLNIPAYDVSNYVFPVLFSDWMHGGLFIIGIFVVGFLLTFVEEDSAKQASGSGDSKRRGLCGVLRYRPVTSAIELALVAGAAWGFSAMGGSKGAENARRDINNDLSLLPNVRLLVGKKEDGAAFNVGPNDSGFKLLTHVGGRFFLIKAIFPQKKSPPDLNAAAASTPAASDPNGTASSPMPSANFTVYVVPDAEVFRIELNCAMKDQI
jgi:hypothetical protein